MKLITAILTSLLAISPMMANAVWCNCHTDRGDPFNDLDQTYSVCANMPNADYAGSTWIRGPHCDVGSDSAGFRERCNSTGSENLLRGIFLDHPPASRLFQLEDYRFCKSLATLVVLEKAGLPNLFIRGSGGISNPDSIVALTVVRGKSDKAYRCKIHSTPVTSRPRLNCAETLLSVSVVGSMHGFVEVIRSCRQLPSGVLAPLQAIDPFTSCILPKTILIANTSTNVTPIKLRRPRPLASDSKLRSYVSAVKLEAIMTGHTSTVGLQASPVPAQKDEVYYWDTARFLVEGCIFKLPKYQFIVGSEYFANAYLQDIVRCPTPELDPEYDWDSMDVTEAPTLKTSTMGAVVLEGVKASEFRTFLKLLFPTLSNTTTITLTKSEWLTILNLSTRWHFPEFRKLAIAHLNPAMSEAIEMITVGRREYIPKWVLQGYAQLVVKKGAITEEESELIGHRTAVKLYIVRHELVENTQARASKLVRKITERFAEELAMLKGEERARRAKGDVRIEVEEEQQRRAHAEGQRKEKEGREEEAREKEDGEGEKEKEQKTQEEIAERHSESKGQDVKGGKSPKEDRKEHKRPQGEEEEEPTPEQERGCAENTLRTFETHWKTEIRKGERNCR
ncbi:hypothetical protein NMY22_g5545 [Coprinellus aureogranulatus]|nr:hypothetical protein NMY22_g5545 [Coprinellus aureogranulatus]